MTHHYDPLTDPMAFAGLTEDQFVTLSFQVMGIDRPAVTMPGASRSSETILGERVTVEDSAEPDPDSDLPNWVFSPQPYPSR